jgi:transducin (beta)-like 1
MNEDGTERVCTSEFTLLKPHQCHIDDKNDDDDNNEMDLEGADSVEVPSDEVTTLTGHTSEVFACAFSPVSDLLASGSGDSSVRMWAIPQGACGLNAGHTASSEAKVLRHFHNGNEKSKDITTLDWNTDGTLLATGAYDGIARIWNSKGELQKSLAAHKGPIFSLKWNNSGKYLLSGSVDKSAIVWDVQAGEVKQKFEFHTAPTLDVDWRDETSFVSSSTDKLIHYCALGESSPIRTFKGHEDEVNAVSWDPSGDILASCSDDFTAKLWNTKKDTCILDLKEHTKEVYTLKWSPTGPGSANPSKTKSLATASFDNTVKIWDVETGSSLYTLTKHTNPVYSVAFSPNGDYLASGSFDRCLYIWSVKDGQLVKSYKGEWS